LADLRQSGKRVVLVLNIPVSSSLNVRYLLSRSINGFAIKEGGVERSSFTDSYGPTRDRLISAAHTAGVSVIDPMDSLCKKGLCPAWYGDRGDPIYKDSEHLSVDFSRQYATFLDQAAIVTQ
jgi:hypothetical protein